MTYPRRMSEPRDLSSSQLPADVAARQTEIYRKATGFQPEFTAEETAGAAGVSLEFAVQILRAFGLAEMDPQTDKLFDEQDVETLRAIRSLLDAGIPGDDLIAVARVYGQAFSRIAEAEQRVYRKHFFDPAVRAGIRAEELDTLEPMSRLLLSLLDAPIRNAHRRQLDNAIRQLVVTTSNVGTEPCAVGFVDLVDYSKLTATLEGAELTQLVSRFDQIAVEACAQGDVRVVKMVGDAVMFVSHDADAAVGTADEIVRAAESDEILPLARAGLDFGDVLPMDGDYFGHPVNVAARLVAVAPPSGIAVSQALVNALRNSRSTAPLGSLDLKGVGLIEAFVVGSG